ncbi:MAG: glycosyltransferase [Prochlorotrichaceae cyanobacterium]|jgi:glycosyltransferase involved in cell wall biosynthesis
MQNSNIIFFTGRLLPPSETFILAQGQSLTTFTPYYVGARRVKGLELPEQQTLVINKGSLLGKAQEGIFKLFGFAPQFEKQIKELNSSLVHAHFGVCGTLILPLMQSIQLPLIVTFYGLDATMTEEYAKQESITTRVYLERKDELKQRTQLFIAVSDFIKKKLLEQGFPEGKVISHYYGVDTAMFTADPSVTRERIVLFVGRLSEKKGCTYLIKAMEKVQSIIEDVKLVIIGDGDLRADLERQAQQSLKRYEFLGLQPSSVVKTWMNRAQIMAVPSVTASNGDSEGLPTVVVEAQSMELPVVGSFHAGIPQAVQHDSTGLLAHERDWETLADHILTLMNNPDRWQDFSQKGRDRMLTYFNLNCQTQKLEQLYQKVIDSYGHLGKSNILP